MFVFIDIDTDKGMHTNVRDFPLVLFTEGSGSNRIQVQ